MAFEFKRICAEFLAPVASPQLTVALERITHGEQNTRIYLRADGNVRYRDLISVKDLLRAGGYLQVALVSRRVPQ